MTPTNQQGEDDIPYFHIEISDEFKETYKKIQDSIKSGLKVQNYDPNT